MRRNKIFEPNTLDDWDEYRSLLEELQAGHKDSKTKSGAVGGMAAKIRARARKDKKPFTKLCPAWLRVEDDEFVVNKRAVDLIRRIFEMVIDGHSIMGICHTLNKEKKATIKAIGDKTQTWSYQSVSLLLHNRRLIGEYQPRSYKNRDKKGIKPKDGDAFQLYLVVISKKLFYGVQKILLRRKPATAGRPTRENVVNLFAGLLYDMDDGTKIYSRISPPLSLSG